MPIIAIKIPNPPPRLISDMLIADFVPVRAPTTDPITVYIPALKSILPCVK